MLLVCSGLDHAHRGFETFARECFEALRNRPEVRIELVKGTGSRVPAETVVPTVTRRTRAARLLGRWLSVRPFIIEHVVFAFALIPLLVRRRPDIVYFSEWHVGRVLGAWRRMGRQSFALIFCNGAFVPGRYGHLDRVQQLAPGAIEYTIERGEPANNQELLPLGVAMEPSPPLLEGAERESLRERLGLPTDRWIVLTVGAINISHKRMDYVIEEIASMPAPRPYVLLVGQEEPESSRIRMLALKRLGADNHDIRMVRPEAMGDYYRVSDVFVLASLWEGFGRVLVEAQSHGLPCLGHRYPVIDWVLGDEGDTADLRETGAVAAWFGGLQAAEFSVDARRRRHASAYERFSWDVLSDRYVAMLRQVAEERRSGSTQA